MSEQLMNSLDERKLIVEILLRSLAFCLASGKGSIWRAPAGFGKVARRQAMAGFDEV
ncbi:MAG: hypothetical protein WAT67_05060 [Candidatus Contendobacter sp.]